MPYATAAGGQPRPLRHPPARPRAGPGLVSAASSGPKTVLSSWRCAATVPPRCARTPLHSCLSPPLALREL